ncbi:hypothetical protein THAOC_08419 [Thalassiosira oceanica]|uniref:Uncharacterized protein n=1 Tax=Thalassiosira oceanica TaxID=159749 RepID=K0TI93_THAOC|nr:hypothetical protein THAOC_08419 [Thalassiosira oceanica]|eukprot:EJK70237.1 hypothetical protein THAOC_08419 [Thalassiosira oceanica]
MADKSHLINYHGVGVELTLHSHWCVLARNSDPLGDPDREGVLRTGPRARSGPAGRPRQSIARLVGIAVGVPEGREPVEDRPVWIPYGPVPVLGHVVKPLTLDARPVGVRVSPAAAELVVEEVALVVPAPVAGAHRQPPPAVHQVVLVLAGVDLATVLVGEDAVAVPLAVPVVADVRVVVGVVLPPLAGSLAVLELPEVDAIVLLVLKSPITVEHSRPVYERQAPLTPDAVLVELARVNQPRRQLQVADPVSLRVLPVAYGQQSAMSPKWQRETQQQASQPSPPLTIVNRASLVLGVRARPLPQSVRVKTAVEHVPVRVPVQPRVLRVVVVDVERLDVDVERRQREVVAPDPSPFPEERAVVMADMSELFRVSSEPRPPSLGGVIVGDEDGDSPPVGAVVAGRAVRGAVAARGVGAVFRPRAG